MKAGAATCPGCGGIFATVEGSTHPYMLGSPGCWAAYGVILAREYQSPSLFAACHRLTVDAYALQHPGDPHDRRARQSVWLHYRSLESVFDRGLSLSQATASMKREAHRPVPAVVDRPVRWSVTVADVVAASPEDHVRQVTQWAQAALDGWRPILGN